jgi:hypothetical protein
VARIPRFTATAGFSIPQGPNVASVEAQAIEAQGRAVADIAGTVSQTLFDYGRARKNIDDNKSKNQSVIAAKAAAQEANEFALTNEAGSPDGSTMLPDFIGVMDERKEEFLEGIEDNDQREQAETVWENIKIGRSDKLLATSRQRHIEHAVLQSDLVKDGYATDTFNDADSFAANAIAMDEQYNVLLENGVIANPAQAESLKTNARQELANSAVLGLVNKEEYDQAKKLITTGELKGEFDTKERQTLINIIENKKIQKTNQNLAEENAQANKDRRDAEKNQQKNFRDFFAKKKTMKEPAQLDGFLSEIDQAVATGELKMQDANYLKSSAVNRDLKFSDDISNFRFQQRIIDGQNLDAVQSDIQRSVVSKAITPDTGTNLINMINTQKDRRFTDPAARQRLQDANRIIEAHFGSQDFIDRLNISGERKRQKLLRRSDAYIDMHRLLGANPALNPVQAARQVSARFLPPAATLKRIPEIPAQLQTNSITMRQGIQELKARRKAGQMSEAVYRKRMEQADELMEAFLREEELKAVPTVPGVNE